MSEGDLSGVALWQSADGSLQIGHCQTCGEHHYYPRQVCPFCFSDATATVPASGRGRVYSYSHTPRGPDGPYIVAYVTLEEGVTMLTHLVDIDPIEVRIDMAVDVEFRVLSDGTLAPVFRKA